MQPLDIQISQQKGAVVARLRGDASNIFTHQVFNALHPVIVRKASRVVLDLTELLFIASTALGELIRFREEVRDYGGSLRLAGANPRVVDVLQKTRLVELFPLYPDAQAALKN